MKLAPSTEVVVPNGVVVGSATEEITSWLNEAAVRLTGVMVIELRNDRVPPPRVTRPVPSGLTPAPIGVAVTVPALMVRAALVLFWNRFNWPAPVFVTVPPPVIA